MREPPGGVPLDLGIDLSGFEIAVAHQVRDVGQGHPSHPKRGAEGVTEGVNGGRPRGDAGPAVDWQGALAAGNADYVLSVLIKLNFRAFTIAFTFGLANASPSLPVEGNKTECLPIVAQGCQK